eukprot:CAMPEP_0178384342 /NCGR_PEP_ID=MMETSP0689_2-20121128/7466_1 /TAXON_ID=160604 /ORGANISM="Amphidinium massartii, Strain CS-259" /LENGTH=868 /DNA_ID=CAMNT_0020004587 /DNA_START=44 /DNA_END=2647 /DNA_ORIENTATION=-
MPGTFSKAVRSLVLLMMVSIASSPLAVPARIAWLGPSSSSRDRAASFARGQPPAKSFSLQSESDTSRTTSSARGWGGILPERLRASTRRSLRSGPLRATRGGSARRDGRGKGQAIAPSADIFAGSGDASPLWLEELQSVGEEIGIKMDDQVDVSEGLAVQAAKEGDIKAATRWSAKLRDSEDALTRYNRVFEAFPEAKRISVAVRWLDVMSKAGLSPNAETYALLAKGRVRFDREYEALKSHIQAVLQDGAVVLGGETWDAVIVTAAKRGDLQTAEQWFQEAVAVEGHSVGLDVFSALVAAATRYEDEASVEKWMELAAGQGITSGTVARTVLNQVAAQQAFLDLIHTSAQSGDVAQAAHWFQQMEASGTSADNTTLGVVVHAAAKSGSEAEKEEWYKKASQAAYRINIHTWTVLLESTAAGGGIETLDKWFDRLVAAGLKPDLKIMTPALKQLATKEDGLEGCKKILAKMQALGSKPSFMLYKLLLDTAASQGDLAALEHWKGALDAANFTLPTEAFGRLCASAVDAAAAVSDYDAAKRWYHLSVEAGVSQRVKIYNGMIRAAASAMGLREALQWREKAEEHAVLRPNNLTHSYLVAAAARESTDLGQQWYARAADAGARLNRRAFVELMAAAAKAQDPDTAVYWVAEAEMAGVPLDAVMVNILIDAAAEVGDLEAAEEWYYQACRIGLVLDEAVFTTLIKAAARSGDLAAAEKWYYEAKQIVGGKTDSFTLNAILHVATKENGTLPEGARLYNQAVAAGTKPDLVTFSVLVQAAARQGEFSTARHWLEEAAMCDISSSDVLAKVLSSMSAREAFKTVILQSARRGDIEEAERWCSQAMRAGMQPSAKVMSTLVLEAAARGDESGAV